MTDEAKLANLAAVETCDIRALFLEQADALRGKILSEAQPKKVAPLSTSHDIVRFLRCRGLAGGGARGERARASWSQVRGLCMVSQV